MNKTKKVYALVKDYYYMLLGTGSSVAYARPPKHYLNHVIKGKVPVILIPGVLGKWGFLSNLGKKISLAGHPVYIVKDLGYNIENIPISAEKVFNVICSIEPEQIRCGVVIVAHSKGGLIGKYLLSRKNTNSNILGMVSIATPFHGSEMAKYFPFKFAKELHTSSVTINELNADKKINTKIVAIFPEYDNHVWTAKEVYLEGAKNIIVPVHGHHRIVFDKKVQEIVLESVESMGTKNHNHK